MRHFLEISSVPSDRMLWSLEFAFDEDEARVARIEARFAEWGMADAFRDDLPGYTVHVLLPRLVPNLTEARPEGGAPSAAEPTGHAGPAVATGADDRTLVARFVRALSEMGAYRTIEPLAARAAEVHLL